MSFLKLRRTIHAKLILDRRGKRDSIEREYDAWQRQLQGSNEKLYSATKQQAERFKRRVKNQNHHGLRMREYPMILRRDCVKLQEQKQPAFRWWIRIPVHPESIWIPIQLPYEQEPLLKLELRECKLLRGEDDEWFVNITVQKQARLKRKYAQYSTHRHGHPQTCHNHRKRQTTILRQKGTRNSRPLLSSPPLRRQAPHNQEMET